MSEFKPTIKTKSKASSFVDNNLKNIISEIDSGLNEDEKREKKIIFNLSKMEYVVHNDPDLSEFYNKLVDENKELYGYHYNEAIMNIIFNVKVLKNEKYLRLYKTAPIKKKKRRDKYGAEDLKTASTKRREKLEKERESKKMRNETTASSGSGAYASPMGWGKGETPIQRKPVWNGGATILECDEKLNEHHLNTKEERIEFIVSNVGDKYGSVNELNALNDNAIEIIYLQTEKDMGINDDTYEDVKDDIIDFDEDIIDTDTDETDKNKNDDEDFDIDEIDIEDIDESKDKQRYKNLLKGLEGYDYDLDDIDDELLNAVSIKKGKENKYDEDSYDDLDEDITINDDEIEESHGISLSNNKLISGNQQPRESYAKYKRNKLRKSLQESKDEQKYKNLLKGISINDFEDEDVDDKMIDYKFKNKKQQTKNKKKKEFVDESSMIEPSDDTISMNRDKNDSMKITKPLTTSSVSGMEEDYKFINSHNEFLSEIAMLKHPSMIRLDRVREVNKGNFKQGIDRIDDLNIGDNDYTRVEDSKKFSEDIEKDVLKRTKGETYKNVGNSSNEKGDEIIKGSITDDENEELDTMRDGMHTIRYNRKPDNRFEERMKRDMGDDMYAKRQRNLKAKENMPMYIKDKQPVSEGLSILGVYKDVFNKNQYLTIDVSKTNIVSENQINDEFTEIKTDGLGNKVNNRFRLNERVDSVLDGKIFYINESTKEIVCVESNENSGMLNESVSQKEIKVMNESLNKMMNLIDYKAYKYIDTAKSKNAVK